MVDSMEERSWSVRQLKPQGPDNGHFFWGVKDMVENKGNISVMMMFLWQVGGFQLIQWPMRGLTNCPNILRKIELKNHWDGQMHLTSPTNIFSPLASNYQPSDDPVRWRFVRRQPCLTDEEYSKPLKWPWRGGLGNNNNNNNNNKWESVSDSPPKSLDAKCQWLVAAAAWLGHFNQRTEGTPKHINGKEVSTKTLLSHYFRRLHRVHVDGVSLSHGTENLLSGTVMNNLILDT